MIETLQVQTMGAFNGRFSSFIMPNLLRDFSLGSGPGHERPVVEEEAVEEEVFSFPYPEDKGEISDIVNPHVMGIAGEVYSSNVKFKGSNARNSSDGLSYVFLSSMGEREVRAYGPEFVSLTRQPEVAGSYANLLVYSGYGVSNFSYETENAYDNSHGLKESGYRMESPGLVIVPNFYREGPTREYLTRLPQSKLENYQNLTLKEIEINREGYDSLRAEVTMDLGLIDVKSDYKPLELTSHLVMDELPALNKINGDVVNYNPAELPALKLEMSSIKADIPDLKTAKLDYGAKVSEFNLGNNMAIVPDINNITDVRDLPFVNSNNDRIVVSDKGYTLARDFITNRMPDERDPKKAPEYNHNNLFDRGDIKKASEYKGEVIMGMDLMSLGIMPFNIGVDDPLLLQKDLRDDSLLLQRDFENNPNLNYDSVPDFSLDIPDYNPTTLYRENVSSDPFGLFVSAETDMPRDYQANVQLRDMLLHDAGPNAGVGMDLSDLVKVNYDNGIIVPFSRGLTTDLYTPKLYSGILSDVENDITDNVEYRAIPQNLEDSIEQEKELAENSENIQEGVNENNATSEEVYDDNAVQEDVYEKGEVKEESEAKQEVGSAAGYAAKVGAAVGLGVLAGVVGGLGALFKGGDEETRLYEPEEITCKSEKHASKNNCENTSDCFAETIDFLEGKLENPTLTDEEYESISECYAEDIKNIQEARDYIKQREIKNPCDGVLYDRFHHVGFTDEQKEQYKLKNYIRDGEVQDGFKLVTTITAGDDLEGDYGIEAIWNDDERGGDLDLVTLKKNSAYAQLDIGLREQGYTPIWKMMSYIDVNTGEKRSGLYLESVAETHLESKELLGDKDEYGMDLSGIILLVNGEEPGKGEVSMHDYDVKFGDNLDVVIKNDSARYDPSQEVSGIDQSEEGSFKKEVMFV